MVRTHNSAPSKMGIGMPFLSGKRAQYKYGIILSLILGLMVLSLSLYFIFNEYFTDDDLNMEVCRQSIQLRSVLPEKDLVGYNLVSFKDSYPLKCKTSVVEIDESDVKTGKYKEIIGDTIASCWALFDKGDSSPFPAGPKLYGSSISSICVPCARIHLTDGAKGYIASNDVTLSIRDSLDEVMDQGFSYYTYLNNSGKKFPAFNPASGRLFNLEADDFAVDSADSPNVYLKNRLTGATEGGDLLGVNVIDFSRVDLPEIFNPENGDLLVNYGTIVSSQSSGIGPYIPYLFYFQAGADGADPFEEVNNVFVDGPRFNNANFCGSWEGIPA